MIEIKKKKKLKKIQIPQYIEPNFDSIKVLKGNKMLLEFLFQNLKIDYNG